MSALGDIIPKENSKLMKRLGDLKKYYELALLTNYFKESQLNRLNHMKIGHLFTGVYGEELIQPNPEIYLKACEPYSCDECVMIGDNLKLDIEVPASLGLHTIFVNPDQIPINNRNTISVTTVEEIDPSLILKLEQTKKSK